MRELTPDEIKYFLFLGFMLIYVLIGAVKMLQWSAQTEIDIELEQAKKGWMR